MKQGRNLARRPKPCSRNTFRERWKKRNTRNWTMEPGSLKFRGFEGVWANAKSVEECRKELVEVLRSGSFSNSGMRTQFQL